MKNLGKVGLVIGALALTSACTKEPDIAKEHRAKGTKLYNQREYSKAAEEYGLSLKANPKQELAVDVIKAKAFAHVQANEIDNAAETTLMLLDYRATPAEKAEVYRDVASVYMKGSIDKAEQYLNKALEIDPKDEFSLGWIAEIYAQKGGARAMAAPAVPEHLDKALTYYDKVLALNPNSANTYLNKRVVMAKYMDYEQKAKEAKEKEAIDNAKDKQIVEEAKASAAAHQARIDEFKQKFDEMTQKFSEATKANAAAASAAQK